VTRSALQVVGHGPVEFMAVCILDHVGNHRGGTAQLRMAKRITRTLFGEEGAVWVMAAFRHHHGAIAVLLHQLVDASEEFFLIELNFREQDDDRNAMVLNQSTCSRDPASVTAHHFEHEHFGRGFGHRAHVKAGLQCGHSDVLGD